ncbi:hypothetical protein HO173_002403 [Letharia columbiana]|uniref:Uncharacterized protein n=1 Tax=Letharia columbiana TaxID=112416 RepID=A0A8H6L8N4_9LECA|nr:uncharacterized protein HO173_002403 [Letharia columbiana]KAF6239856.1 hypothetical protein HO173_002403 [Letharia columbiana]
MANPAGVDISRLDCHTAHRIMVVSDQGTEPMHSIRAKASFSQAFASASIIRGSKENRCALPTKRLTVPPRAPSPSRKRQSIDVLTTYPASFLPSTVPTTWKPHHSVTPPKARSLILRGRCSVIVQRPFVSDVQLVSVDFTRRNGWVLGTDRRGRTA